MTVEVSGRAVVTGAASGIGRATAELLRDAGVDVVAVDRDAAGLEAVAGVERFACDLRRPADRRALICRTAGVRYLVNAAGVLLVKPITECTVDDLRWVFEVNVEALWDLTQGIGATLAAGGAIVNISSTAARLNAVTEAAIYSASKAAVLSITRSFAHAYAPNVRVNAVCPGLIGTAMGQEVLDGLAAIRGTTPDDVLTSRLAGVPLGRMATAVECAGVIAFLLSDTAGYLTGQAISNDGGVVML